MNRNARTDDSAPPRLSGTAVAARFWMLITTKPIAALAAIHASAVSGTLAMKPSGAVSATAAAVETAHARTAPHASSSRPQTGPSTIAEIPPSRSTTPAVVESTWSSSRRKSPTSTPMPIGPAAAENEATHNSDMRTVSSGRIGGADVVGLGSPEGGRVDRPNATIATTTKTSRQSIAASRPPANGASAAPAAWKLEYTPIARPSRIGAITSVRPAIRSGVMNALHTPWRTRAPMNHPSVGATTQSTEAAA